MLHQQVLECVILCFIFSTWFAGLPGRHDVGVLHVITVSNGKRCVCCCSPWFTNMMSVVLVSHMQLQGVVVVCCALFDVVPLVCRPT